MQSLLTPDLLLLGITYWWGIQIETEQESDKYDAIWKWVFYVLIFAYIIPTYITV